MAVSADEQAIAKQISEFGKLVGERQYAQAHGMMSERFRSRVTSQQFADTFDIVAKQPAGAFKSAAWNGRAVIEDGPTGKVALVGTLATFGQSPEPARWDIRLTQTGGQWSLDTLPFFQEEKKRK
jgi:hypothetical protein